MRVLGFCAALAIAAAPTPARAEEKRIAPGRWLIVYGRLLECPAWKNRAIDVARVPADGRVDLLDLGIVDARGKTPADLETILAVAYEARVSRPIPEIRVHHVDRFEQLDQLEVGWIIESLRAMADRRCRRGQPAPQDHWTPDELLRIRNRAYG